MKGTQHKVSNRSLAVPRAEAHPRRAREKPSRAQTVASTAAGTARPLRADASRNRERLLSAAQAVFIEQGAYASLDDIAKRAQVGIGTLYRHFPTREALLAATSDERLLILSAETRARDAAVPAFENLCLFLEHLVRHASTYRGLAAQLGIVLKNGSPGCHAATEEGQRLLRQAQKAGAVRRDIAFADVVCMATAISLAVAESSGNARRIEQLVMLFVDGLRTRRA